MRLQAVCMGVWFACVVFERLLAVVVSLFRVRASISRGFLVICQPCIYSVHIKQDFRADLYTALRPEAVRVVK